MTTFLDYDVLDFVVPDRARDIRVDRSRKVTMFGEFFGIRTARSPALQPVDAFPVAWIVRGRDEINAMLDFIQARLGRTHPTWVPSGQQDLIPVEATASTLTFSSFGYTEFMYPAYLNRRTIVIHPRVGSPVYASILSAVDNEDGTETIGVDADLTSLISEIDEAKVSFLYLVRFSNDETEIEWENSTVARCTMKFVEVPQTEIPDPIDHSGEFPEEPE